MIGVGEIQGWKLAQALPQAAFFQTRHKCIQGHTGDPVQINRIIFNILVFFNMPILGLSCDHHLHQASPGSVNNRFHLTRSRRDILNGCIPLICEQRLADFNTLPLFNQQFGPDMRSCPRRSTPDWKAVHR